jgi:hypothetical protein
MIKLKRLDQKKVDQQQEINDFYEYYEYNTRSGRAEASGQAD